MLVHIRIDLGFIVLSNSFSVISFIIKWSKKQGEYDKITKCRNCEAFKLKYNKLHGHCILPLKA